MDKNVLVRLASSRKFVVLCLAVARVGAMVFAGKATFTQFVDLVKWGAGLFMASTAYEDAKTKPDAAP